jgi:hypothetical protein
MVHICMKRALANIVQREHQQAIQNHKLVMRVHAADELIELPVRHLLNNVRCELELDDMKLSAHDSAMSFLLLDHGAKSLPELATP